MKDQVQQVQLTHERSMKAYEQKFESNCLLSFFDLWEYVERKLAAGTTLFVHPLAEQHPSASAQDPYQLWTRLQQANEVDAINQLSTNLDKLIEDEFTPPKVKEQAQFF